MKAEDIAKRVVEEPGRVVGREEARVLLEEASTLLASEPSLLELDAEKLLVIGDTHGDLETSIRASSFLKDGYALLFLGDYVDRGPRQVENINFLIGLKLLNPEEVFLLRGNHETPLMNEYYGFLLQVDRVYGLRFYYEAYLRAFSNMPYAAIFGDNLGLHGGVPSTAEKAGDLAALPKADPEPRDPTAFQVLWNDPSENLTGFAPSPRGGGALLFGRDVAEKFLEKSGIRRLVRAHEFFPEGYHRYFGGLVLSLFSCRYYPGTRPKALLLEKGVEKIVSLE